MEPPLAPAAGFWLLKSKTRSSRRSSPVRRSPLLLVNSFVSLLTLLGSVISPAAISTGLVTSGTGGGDVTVLGEVTVEGLAGGSEVEGLAGGGVIVEGLAGTPSVASCRPSSGTARTDTNKARAASATEDGNNILREEPGKVAERR